MKTEVPRSDGRARRRSSAGTESNGGGDAAGPPQPRGFSWARAMFYSHLWGGVLVSVLVLVISITGIVLNHKRGLGIMPEVEHSPTGEFSSALSMSELANRAFAAIGATPEVGGIDRMDVRPRNGLIKIRMRDEASTEVTLDINDGTVLHVGPRGDVFMEKLHSGEIFGANGILLSDVGAVGLIILIISGYWLWLKPRLR